MAADGRFAARLAGLSHDALLAYAIRLSSLHRHTADALLVPHSPFPDWARDEVLLSEDLLPKLLVVLDLTASAAAAVCHAWHSAWQATDDHRRGLRRPTHFELPFSLRSWSKVIALPGSRLLLTDTADDETPAADETTRIADVNMQTISCEQQDESIVPLRLSSFAGLHGGVATGSDLFLCFDIGAALRRYPVEDLALVDSPVCTAEFTDDEDSYNGFDAIALAPNNRIFTVGYQDNDGESDEVCCFSADTLEVKYKFGRGRFKGGVFGLAVCGQELIATDRADHRLQVFSFDGEHQRDVVGRFRRPEKLLHFDGRLYLVEEADFDTGDPDLDEEEEMEYEQLARRIFVLTPEGDTLQIYKLADKDRHIENIAILDRRLIVFTNDDAAHGNRQAFALKGA
jgi:hypothetical protein